MLITSGTATPATATRQRRWSQQSGIFVYVRPLFAIDFLAHVYLT